MIKNLVNKFIPWGKLSLLGLQHVLAMCAGTIIVPLILGSALGMSQKDLSYLISVDFFTCGIATIIQAHGIRQLVGIRLPVVMGCSSIAIIPLIIIGKIYGITAIYGAIITSGILMLLIAPFSRFLIKFFPAVVTGTVITTIGLSLILIAVKNVIGGTGTITYGLTENLSLAILALASIILINKYCRGFLQTIAVLLSLVIGTVIAYLWGKVDFSILKTSTYGWFRMIHPFYFGTPQFKISAIASMCLVSLVNMIDSIGVFLILGKICEKEITQKNIVAGFRAEGIAQILGGIFNAFPYITFSQNVGLVALTRTKNCYVTVMAGIILMLLGFIPKIAILITIIPAQVLGGTMLVLFGIVATTGIRILSEVDFGNGNNLLIIGITIGVSLGVSSMPNLFNNLPGWSQILFGNGIVIGCIIAILLNLFLNGITRPNITSAPQS